MKLSQANRAGPKRVLLFGPPKSGKTELAGKLSEKFNLIWIDCENGHSTLFKLPAEWQDRIELINIPDTRSTPEAIATCLHLIKGTKKNICVTHGKVDCATCALAEKKFPGSALSQSIELNAISHDTIVVFDSLTQLTNSAIAHISRNRLDDYKFEYDDWAQLGKLMDTFLSHVQQAGFHVVCISHETETEMEDGKMKLVPTAGTRNFSRNTAKYFDEVVYVEVKNGKHKAASSTLYNPKILTGSRTGNLLESTGEPSLIPIFQGVIKPPESAQAATKVLSNLTSKFKPS